MTYSERLEDAISEVQVYLEDYETELPPGMPDALGLVLDGAWRYLELND